MILNSVEGKNQCIVVLTKNRPNVVLNTLRQLDKVDFPIILIDDSTTKQTKTIVKKKFFSNELYYHGRIEQDKFIENLKMKNYKINGFVKSLGQNGWNLGYVRNYSLILCRALQFQKILFVDDDITVKNADLIYQNMESLDQSDFIGSKIAGMPDCSVVDHILNKLGKNTREFLSGGFLAFRLDAVTEFFFNYYNEDWIWLYLHKSNGKIMRRHGTAYQNSYDIYKNIIQRATQQEFGEILVEGVRQSIEHDDHSKMLIDVNYWRKIMTDRVTLIKEILCLSQTRNFKTGIKLSIYLLDKINQIDEQDFAKAFTYYFKKNEEWRELLDMIKNDHIVIQTNQHVHG